VTLILKVIRLSAPNSPIILTIAPFPPFRRAT
jgi:hypothetical protein